MDDRRIFEEEWTIEETSQRKTRKRTGGNGEGVKAETYPVNRDDRVFHCAYRG